MMETNAVEIIKPQELSEKLFDSKRMSISPQETAILTGDLSKLSSVERSDLYGNICKSLALNPLTRPFEYISFSAGKDRPSKLTLYIKKDGTEQLRKINKISTVITNTKTIGDIYIVTAMAKDQYGRVDESTGAVCLKGKYGMFEGDMLANAYMKAETKAKRRATLAFCGLGMLDESETDSIPGAIRMDAMNIALDEAKKNMEGSSDMHTLKIMLKEAAKFLVTPEEKADLIELKDKIKSRIAKQDLVDDAEKVDEIIVSINACKTLDELTHFFSIVNDMYADNKNILKMAEVVWARKKGELENGKT